MKDNLKEQMRRLVETFNIHHYRRGEDVTEQLELNLQFTVLADVQNSLANLGIEQNKDLDLKFAKKMARLMAEYIIEQGTKQEVLEQKEEVSHVE